MRNRITLAIGLALSVVAVLVVLQHSPLTVAATNGVQARTQLDVLEEATTVCQYGQALPQRISAIRLSFEATTGPKIAVAVSSNGHVMTRGVIGSGWYGSAVTVPMRPLPRAYSDVKICARFGSLIGRVGVSGEPASTVAPAGSGLLAGRLRIVYLRPSARSWWSLAGSVIEQMARGRAASGRWIVFPIAALIASAIALASLALTRELR